MPAASDPTTSFELKSTQWPLLALALRSADTQQLARDWQQRYGDAVGFFEQDALVLDFSAIEAADQACDLPALLRLLRSADLRPLAFRGGSHALREQAAAAGLACADDAADTVQNRVFSQAQPPTASPAASPAASATSSATSSSMAAAAELAPVGALLIDRPLRSGQQVYARGRDLIVMAMVNPGAEVVADGHIHVYAPLRGKAIAGARGNENARIFSSCLEAELLAIAGTYRTSEVPLPPPVQGKPAMVRLLRNAQGERLLIEPIA